MNKFKQFYFSLCLALVFFVGSLLTNSLTVFAYDQEDNFYRFDHPLKVQIISSADTELYKKDLTMNEDGHYYFENPQLNDVSLINMIPTAITETTPNAEWTFPFNPDKFDYYFIGSLTAVCTSDSLSTFKPTYVGLSYYDVNDIYSYYYDSSEINIYNIDGFYYRGFGFSSKIDFESANNTGIRNIMLKDDIHGSGNKPPNLSLEMGIMAIEKGQSQTAVMHQILEQLEIMESSINNSISDIGNQVTDAVEDQYDMAEDEDFGIGEIEEQVDEKLGVLNFGADTLGSFLDLFSSETVGDSTITFPAFSMKIQGVDYKVWNDIEFDLSFLEDNFSILINAVRVILVLTVWLAVLGYLVKAKDELINNRG